MGLRTTIIRLFAQYRMRQIYRQASQAIAIQEALLPKLINRARNTKFGRDHGFSQVQNHHHFTAHVPIRDYEGLRSYVEEVVQGIPDVLWPGLPTYLAKTSGTTSGTKYIPMTKESTPHHVRSARDSLFAYVNRTGKADFFAHKMVYLSGSPELSKTNGILTGRLSGIVNHQIPAWIKGNKLPSRSVNVIEDWEQKVAAMVEEARDQDISLIGGIPPWVQMFYEELLRKTNKEQVLDVFPNFQVFVYGGVNFAPYRQKLDELVGRSLDVIETYPASEGFLAFQDSTEDKGLLLNTNAGIFFEFVPSSEISNQNPKRLTLAEVEVGVNYAVILTTNAGLWAYNIGDTVEFVSIAPHRIRVTGRIKHFISAFGEHVIGKEVEEAMVHASSNLGININEFTVAPQVSPEEGLPYHEWFVATDDAFDVKQLAQLLDTSIQNQNIYYRDLIEGQILQPAVVRRVPPDAFRRYMQEQGKLGGQNKVPRLANDRKIADWLQKHTTG